MISTELHYVSFAADIYGANLHEVTNMTQRSELAGFYRDNPELFAGRIQAAVELVRTLEEVDAENVAIIGYCFGGTGVLTYGLLAFNDVKAIVSFHGGLSAIPDAGDPVTPKILVLSGGDDDASTDIRDLEMTLDIANADWEITRYSGVEHAFTVFDDERYNKWADMRSWDSMKEFLADAFGFISFKSEQPESANVVNVDYTDVDGTELRGYLAKPSDEWQPQYATVVLLP
jgi:dienelactone hydrolase